MFIDDCTNCKIILGPCDGSIMIRTTKNCSISVIAKQIRFRDCENLKIFSYCPCDPIIESSNKIMFGPYNAVFPRLKELFTQAGFEANTNQYQNIYDFSGGKNSQTGQSWDFITIDDFVFEEIKNPDTNEKCEFLYDTFQQELENFSGKQYNLESNPFDEEIEDENYEDVDIDQFGDFFGNKAKTKSRKTKKNEEQKVEAHSSNITDVKLDGSEEIHEIQKEEPKQEEFKLHEEEEIKNNYILSPNEIKQEQTQEIIINPKKQEDNFFEISSNNDFKFNNNRKEEENIVVENEIKVENTIEDKRAFQMEDGFFQNIPNNNLDTNNNMIDEDIIKPFNKSSTYIYNTVEIPTNSLFSYNHQPDELFHNEEEAIAAENRRLENEERIKKIRKKQEDEIKMKSDLRSKAFEFIQNFNDQRNRKRGENLKQNRINEGNYLEEKKSLKSANPWDRVVEHIDIKESNYKGVKDVSRMRETIIGRRNDYREKKLN
jgi:hypothetical protein